MYIHQLCIMNSIKYAKFYKYNTNPHFVVKIIFVRCRKIQSDFHDGSLIISPFGHLCQNARLIVLPIADTAS